MSRTRWLVCALCGKADKTTPGHVGTSVAMRCNCESDSPDQRYWNSAATRCRDCCVTGHHTRWREPIAAGDRQLHDVLRELELTTRTAEHGRKDLLDGRRVVFTGTADDVWKWLRATKRVAAEVAS